jgi:hypothetical protein
MTAKTSPKIGAEADANTRPAADQVQAKGERPNLTYRYGTIGIQAVAAAARYAGVRKNPVQPTSARIDQRFVESAV